MNSMQRVLATVAGHAVDRPPFTAVLSLYGFRFAGGSMSDYYSDPLLYAKGQSAVSETFSPDILFSPFAFASVAEAFGSEVRFFEDHPPILKRPALASIQELEKLVLPDPDRHPRLAFLRESVRQMKADHGDSVAIAGVLMSPADLPAMILGMESWLETVLFDPAGAERMLSYVEPFFVRMANCLLAAGATFIAIPSVFLSPAMLPRQIVIAQTLPTTRRALASVNGPVVMHHAGGRFLSHSDLVADLPHVVGLVLDHEDNLGQGRSLVGAQLTLLGGISGPDLGASSASAVAAQARAVLEDRRNDPHFILSTTGPDVALETPPENIQALRQAVCDFA